MVTVCEKIWIPLGSCCLLKVVRRRGHRDRYLAQRFMIAAPLSDGVCISLAASLDCRSDGRDVDARFLSSNG